MTTNANEPVSQNTAIWMGLSYPTAKEVMDLLLFAKISPQSDTWAWRLKSSILFDAVLSHVRQTSGGKPISTRELAKAMHAKEIDEQCRLIVSQAHQRLLVNGPDLHDEDLMAQIPYGSKKLVRYYTHLPHGGDYKYLKPTPTQALLNPELTKIDSYRVEQHDLRSVPILSFLDTFAEIEKSEIVLSELYKVGTRKTMHIANWVQNFANK